MNTTSAAADEFRLPKQRGERIRLPRHSLSPDPSDPGDIRSWLEDTQGPLAIDMFSGAGGLSLGLEEAGFHVVAAADSDVVAMETHAANIQGLTWVGDLSNPNDFLTQLREWGIDRVDLLAGGPPCQPFSRAGTSKIGHLVRMGVRDSNDQRADLWKSFFEVIDQLKPRAVLFENVPDFATAQGGALLIALADELRARGYDHHVRILEAWRYGVPQHRSRLFVVGVSAGLHFEWPEGDEECPTLWDAIGDLPLVEANTRDEVQEYASHPEAELGRRMRQGLPDGEAEKVRDHITRAVREDDAAIYHLMEQGASYLDVPEDLRRYRADIFNDKYYRLSCDSLSRTITAHIAKDGYWYIHPRQDRTLSIREAARIQTFPDRFRFAGYPSSRYRQIGNAVPPMLASAIGSAVLDTLESGSPSEECLAQPGTVVDGFRQELVNWFAQNRRSFVWRERELNPWQVLMLEMCLHRTRAEQVDRIVDKLITLGATPAEFLANIESLEPELGTLGLWWRMDKLVSAATHIRDELNGEVPDGRQALMAIPGVGDYIASAVLCFAFGRPSVLMDTNTRRIARRVLGEDDRCPDWLARLHLHTLAGRNRPDVEWNQGLLDLGALVCRARVPACQDCPVQMYCSTGSHVAGCECSDDPGRCGKKQTAQMETCSSFTTERGE